MKRILFIVLMAMTMFNVGCNSNEPKPNEPTLEIGTVDINGIVYPTVKIGNQTWTTINYRGAGGVDYENTPFKEFGKLYPLAALKDIVLPDGWRIPTKEDYKTLIVSQGGNLTEDGSATALYQTAAKFRTKDWNKGTNLSGFNVYSAGMYIGDEQRFSGSGEHSVFWTTTPYPNNNLYTHTLHVQSESVSINRVYNESKCSLRFVKDN